MIKLFKKREILIPAEGAAMLADAIARVPEPSRRAFLQRSVTLGGLTLLTGYSLGSEESIEAALNQVSRFNDRVQGMLFDPARLAPTYPESMITQPFPYMATALHPQTLMALSFNDRPLPPRYGFPMKLRMPTKLGYKNPKHVQAIFVTNTHPGGYWEDQGYNWFGGS